MVVMTKWRFTVDEFTKMSDAGIFGSDARVELIDGEVIQMAAHGDRHVECVIQLNRLLGSTLGNRAIVSPQNPVQLSDYREPLPDFALLRPLGQRSRRGVPPALDVLLVIEVSESSLEFDRDIKRPRYAESGIAETWIVNLVDNVIEVSRNPTPDGYADRFVASPGERIAPVAFPDISFAVDDILPYL